MDTDYTGGTFNNAEPSSSESVPWWKKSELYKNEKRFFSTPVPLWRMVLSVGMIYGFYLGADFTSSLCTHGSKFICAVSLIVSTVYIYWALWWDEPVIIPPTLTFFNRNQYNTLFSLLMVSYETTLIATATLVVTTAMLFTYVPLEDIFKWDC